MAEQAQQEHGCSGCQQIFPTYQAFLTHACPATVECPLCNRCFLRRDIEPHAARCQGLPGSVHSSPSKQPLAAPGLTTRQPKREDEEFPPFSLRAHMLRGEQDRFVLEEPPAEPPRPAQCTGCQAEFGSFTITRSCRNCGQWFCRVCSARSVSILRLGLLKSQTVCLQCYDQLVAPRPKTANHPKCQQPGCEVIFGLFGRHHCRSCGRSICHDHSPHMWPLPLMGYTTPQRVCNLCYPYCKQDTKLAEKLVELATREKEAKNEAAGKGAEQSVLSSLTKLSLDAAGYAAGYAAKMMLAGAEKGLESIQQSLNKTPTKPRAEAEAEAIEVAIEKEGPGVAIERKQLRAGHHNDSHPSQSRQSDSGGSSKDSGGNNNVSTAVLGGSSVGTRSDSRANRPLAGQMAETADMTLDKETTVDTNDADDEKTCVVCLEGKRDHAILMCMHVCLCAQCGSQKMEACPICRAPVTAIKRVFL
eukprot:g65698.t1